jgi:hypothetical protein
MAVGSTHNQMDLLSESRAFGFVLFDQIPQELFAGNLEDDFANRLIGVLHRSLSNPIQNPFFVGDVVNALRSEQILPSNLRNCPQS